MKPFDVDAQGYGTWAYRNRRVIIKPVYGVGSTNHGYKYKIAGHFHYIPCGRGWNSLERCLHFAAHRIDRLVGPETYEVPEHLRCRLEDM